MTENTRRIAELQREVAGNPASRQFYQLGELLRRDGRAEEAADTLRAGLAHHARYVAAWVALGRACLESAHGDEALRALSQALALDAQNPVAWRLLGEAHLAVGDRSGALEAMRRCLELVPGDDVLEAAVEALAGEPPHAAAPPPAPPEGEAAAPAPQEPPGPAFDVPAGAAAAEPPALPVEEPPPQAAAAAGAATAVMDVFGELPTVIEPIAGLAAGVERPAAEPFAAEPRPEAAGEVEFELAPPAPPAPSPEAPPAEEPLQAHSGQPAAEAAPEPPPAAAEAEPPAQPAAEPAPAAEAEPVAWPVEAHLFTAPPALEAPAVLQTVLAATAARAETAAVQPPATLALARLYVQQQALDEAVIVLERMLEREPSNIEAQDLLALVRDMMAPLPEAPTPLSARERKIAALQRWLASLTLGQERAAR